MLFIFWETSRVFSNLILVILVVFSLNYYVILPEFFSVVYIIGPCLTMNFFLSICGQLGLTIGYILMSGMSSHWPHSIC